MQLTIVAVDKLREPYLRAGGAVLAAKLAKYSPVDIVEIRASSAANESRGMLARIDNDDVVWALDREGQLLSSTDLARKLTQVQRSGLRRLVLLIGGADGLPTQVLKRAEFRWSLSPLTFLHEMARLIVLEQLYRAHKINRGEPYHR